MMILSLSVTTVRNGRSPVSSCEPPMDIMVYGAIRVLLTHSFDSYVNGELRMEN